MERLDPRDTTQPSEPFRFVRVIEAGLVVVFALSSQAFAADAPVSFREHVAPILVKSCLGCHNAKKASGGLNMTTFASFKKGGKSFGAEILAPGDPEASMLLESIGPDGQPRMPYKLPPLPDAAIKTITAWVVQGAKFDGPSEAETPIASLVDPLRGLPDIKPHNSVPDPVTALAFAPDGLTLAAGVGRDVVLIDPSTGKPKAKFAGHLVPITTVQFTADGKQLIVAGGRAGLFGAIAVWEVATGKRLLDARGHADTILAAELSPDGQVLATAGYDRLVILWDPATLKPIRTLKDHTDSVYAVAFSSDGKRLASAGADRTVKLWDVASGKREQTLSDATAELYAVAFARNGATVFAAGVDRTIRAWNVADKEAPLIRSAFAHDSAVIRLVVAADGKTLASSGEDRTVKLWDVPTLTPRATLPAQPDWPQSLAISRDSQRLAVGRFDGSVALFDTSSGKPGLTVQASAAAVAPAPSKPELAREASLNPPAPRAVRRGVKSRITLSGNAVGRATEVVFPEADVTAEIVTDPKPDPNRLTVDLTVAPTGRVGMHAFSVVTPSGVPAFKVIAIEAEPETAETEPNDDRGAAKNVALPAELAGTIDHSGDVDHFRITAKQGDRLVFAMNARPLGSGLLGSLAAT